MWPKVSEQFQIGPPKTTGGRRRVDLDQTTIEILVKHQKRMRGFSDYVFARDTDLPQSPDVVTQTFKALVKEAGLPPITLHALRDTWATLAMERGVSIKVVAERLGIAELTALVRYSHVRPGVHSEAAKKVAEAIDEG